MYFKNDGRSFKSGTRLLFDDNTVREMVEIHRPLGRIDLYVDHYELEEVIDCPQRQVGEDEAADNERGEDGLSDDSDPSDPEYDVETESDESEEDSLYDEFGESNDQLRTNRENSKKFKESLNVKESADRVNNPRNMSDKS